MALTQHPDLSHPSSTPMTVRGSEARRIRVMLFTDSFIHGGTERQFVAALQLLDRERFDLRVGCLKRCGPFLPQVEALGVPIHEFPVTSLYGWSTCGLLRGLVRLLREERIELVHTF